MAVKDVSAVEVGHDYIDLYHRLHRIIDQEMCAAGVSLARFKVLMRLSEGGPMNQATLAGLLGFAPRSVTDTVDALERDGLVVRSEDPNDRRARIVGLTPNGHDAFEAGNTARTKLMNEIFGSLSAPDRATFVALVAEIRTNLPTGDNPCVQ